MFTLKQDTHPYDQFADVNTAADLAETFLDSSGDEVTTFTVENDAGEVFASVTNRRIVGTFSKQQWGGRKNDVAFACGEEEFDATDAILLMEHGDLIEMEDCSEQSDEVGRSHVDWSGPCSVHITGSICQFFGVSDVEEITPQNLAFVRNRLNPKPVDTQTITLSVKVVLSVAAGTDVNEFIENMDYSIVSKTVGIVVKNTEIVDSN